MKQDIERLWVLLHEPEGPLVPYLDLFARSLAEQGFRHYLLGRQIRVVAKFSKWLLEEEVPIESVTFGLAKRFFEDYKGPQSVHRGEFATLRRLISFLVRMEIVRPIPEPDPATPVQQAVAEFAAYLLQERALSDKTLIKYCPFVECFLVERFGDGPVNPAALSGGDVISFVMRRAEHLSPAVAKSATTALRSYFRYLCYCGVGEPDLVAAVPTVPNWSMTEIPRAITPDHLRAVLAHCPRNTPIGRRDYAILMLLARLGLRSSEIVSLTLDSIDWDAASLSIVGKGDHGATLPMPVAVGEALADYLRQGRPSCSSRSLFLRACAPIRGLGAQQTIATIVGAAIKRAGIETRYHGAHQFRHALAADMLRHEATLSEIGSLLRHRHPKTTGIYAKVDFAALRPLSLPWPGAVK